MKVLFAAGLLSVVIASATGCAVGNVYDYRSASVMLPVQGNSSVSFQVAAGGGAMMGQHNEAVRRAFEAKMSQLFADPEIKAALSD